MSDNKFSLQGLSEIGKSIDKRGWFKTIFLYLIFYIIPFFSIEFFLNKKLEKSIINQQTQVVNIKNGDVLGTNNPDNTSNTESIIKTTNISSSFNQNDWLIKNFNTDTDGFLCPTVNNFEYWSIWTKKEFPLQIKNIKLRIYIKSNPKSKVPPTITITYGSYSNGYAPQQLYRLNIFDSNTETIRLYNENNKSKSQDWLQETPDINSEMMIILSPRVPDPNGRKININPVIKYAVKDSDTQKEFAPQNFEVVLPTVAMKDETLNKQIGVGTQKGNCFKITAFEVEQ